MKCLLFTLAAAASLHAQIQFTRIDSPHFELYTDGAKSRAVAILQHFERVRSFFAQTINPRESPRTPRIVVLNNQRTFATFVDRKSTAAYYIGLPHRDLIVIGPTGNGADANTITHEYIHLLVRQSGLRLPLWLNEGIAEVYSTLQVNAGKMRVGIPIAHHLQRLRSDWLDVRQVLKAESYGAGEHVGTLYSMSWAIAHMLMLEIDLRPKFPRFLDALEKGQSPETALRRAYGLTPQQLEQHVQGYIRSKTVSVVEFNFKWQDWDDKAAPAPASALASGLTLIDLHLSGKDFTAAIHHAERLAAQFPQDPGPWEALASAHLYQDNLPAALQAVEQAFARGSNCPNLLARAAAQLTDNQPLARQMLTRALAAEPGHFEANLQLTRWHLQAKDPSAAFETIKKLTSISHADVPRFVAIYAQAAIASGNPAAAKQAVDAFRAAAASDADQRAAENLTAYVERSANSTVTGLLVEVACPPSRQILHLQTSDGPRHIIVDPAQALLLTGEEVNVACGPQKRKPRVRIGLSPDGLARKLEFLP